MLWQYIIDRYDEGEPIISSDIKLDMSESNCRRQFKILTDEGKLRRYENGVYYIPKKSSLGTEIPMLLDYVIESKYISRNEKVFGYYSGLTFANQIGATTQMPAVKEIVTNKIGSPIKRIEKDNRLFIIRKSRTEISEDNVRILQFLDFMEKAEKYSELDDSELSACIARYVRNCNIIKTEVDKYLPLYPNKIYKSIYETGLVNVLTQ